MNQAPEIKLLPSKKLAGMMMHMNFATHQPSMIWKQFMPRRKEIVNAIGTDLFSMEIFPEGFFNQFNPETMFEKWAAVEVSSLENIPAGMLPLTVPESLFAVFIHKGLQSEAQKTYDFIFREWLPSSDFMIDQRPHMAVMGNKYKPNDATSEEEIWIPVKPK